jgi:pyruvate formate-lyase/glycerol dehydratase family glycyl radical enzyme
MNPRIKNLREQSINAVNRISSERALLVTEFYKNELPEGLSYPLQRAYCLKYILENKFICINDGELIVGERGTAPKATPTYPEINIHSLKDLDILDKREKVFFKVDKGTRKSYENIIIPYWKGKSHRDRMFSAMPEGWINAYHAGMYTEFQEQRAPGHTVLGDKIYKKGMLDIKNDISESISKLDKKATEELEELKAMDIVADAVISFAKRHADKLEELEKNEKDPERKKELKKIAMICRHVPANKPGNFHEALQYYWFVHLGVITELNPWDSFNPGRLDRHLYFFYKKDIENGILTEESARELLQALWIKFNNQPSPPKVGVTAQESNTYTDFALINLGGLTENGENAVNELSYLILDVIEEMRLLQPSSMIQVSRSNPEKFLQRALKIVKTGFGQPSIFNTDEIIQELVRQGKKVEDARNGGASGCVESGAFGTESYILTGYFNLSKILELVLHNGVDPHTGKQLGLKTGDPKGFNTFDDLLKAYKKQLNYFIDKKINGNIIIEKLFADYLPAPFLSILIDDCIANGKDYNAGGARYNTSYIQGVGLGSLSDSLTSIQYHVFDKKTISMKEMTDALDNDFKGFEKLRYDLIYNTPKYGNDDDYADANSKRIFEMFFEAVDGKPTARGGVFRINLLPTTSHVYFGSKINALPDGRKAKEPLSEGISPVQGTDTNGPTSVIKSAAKIDHIRTGGTLLNLKFSPQFFNNDESIAKLGSLVRSYFKLNGHHIQFNVVSADTLKDAQKHPERYRDLIVRVAGYSDYFNDLGTDLQNEIIRRTEHGNL